MSFVIDKTVTDKPPKKRSFRSLLGTVVYCIIQRQHLAERNYAELLYVINLSQIQ